MFSLSLMSLCYGRTWVWLCMCLVPVPVSVPGPGPGFGSPLFCPITCCVLPTLGRHGRKGGSLFGFVAWLFREFASLHAKWERKRTERGTKPETQETGIGGTETGTRTRDPDPGQKQGQAPGTCTATSTFVRNSELSAAAATRAAAACRKGALPDGDRAHSDGGYFQ